MHVHVRRIKDMTTMIKIQTLPSADGTRLCERQQSNQRNKRKGMERKGKKEKKERNKQRERENEHKGSRRRI